TRVRSQAANDRGRRVRHGGARTHAVDAGRGARRGRGRVSGRVREPVPVQSGVSADVRRPAAPGRGRAQGRSSADDLVWLSIRRSYASGATAGYTDLVGDGQVASPPSAARDMAREPRMSSAKHGPASFNVSGEQAGVT